MTITLQFLGAARHVTGSKHLLVVNDRQILLECGMVQGPRAIADRANRELPLAAGDLDAVVLSHAHIDHSGLLPRLTKLGFEGPIHCTSATKSLIEILLADSAHIQAGDARHLRKRGIDYQPYYDQDDVDRTLRQCRGVGYHTRVEVCPEVSIEFLDAGHILGAAMVVIDVDDGRHKLRICFTGDHGRKDLPILRDHERLPECDVLITESTYGDRLHESNPDMERTLAEIVNQEIQDGGRILIPAFSVGRTQNVVLFLGKLMESGEIPKLPVFVDSPLSKRATKVMAQYPELYDDETRNILEGGGSPFYFEGVRYVADVEESKSLNDVRSGVIVAASGMCEAGRILHHLERSLGRREDCVLMVGFQAESTLGRKLLDGYDDVKIYGQRHRVRCKVRAMGGFSAHADYQELVDSYGHLAPSLERTFVVHGEEHPALTHANRLTDLGFKNVEVPVKRQKFVLRK